MLRLLLDEPSLATRLPNVDFNVLIESAIPGMGLLVDVHQYCRQNPSAHTGSVLEHYRNRPESAHLSKLLQQEFLIEASAVESVFKDSFKTLINWHFEQRMEILMTKSRVQGLSAAEKQELNLLMQAKKPTTTP